MYTIDLSGKNALVFGVANQRSIAWAIAQALHSAGATVALAYQNERLREPVEALSAEIGDAPLFQCDMSVDDDIVNLYKQVGESMGSLSILVHSVAFANRDDLGGEFSKTDREGFRLALDVSSYTIIPMIRHAAPLMQEGGTVLAMTFLAAEKVFPGYNVMGVAKAALENSVKQLAAEYGPAGIRVNAISAGPLDTLSSRVISGYRDMKRIHAERASMGRNITHDDVGGTALYLCSNLSSGVTGEVIHVDAGYSIMGI